MAIREQLRLAGRLTGCSAWTGAWAVLYATGAVLTLPVPRLRLAWRHRATRRWARGMAGLIGMRREIRGRAPRPPFLLVTNHLSYVDILLLYSCVEGVFVAKRDMRSWPLLGLLAQLVGTIWVRREVRRDALRVLDRIGAAIARRDGVLLFPEGTTSSGGEVLPLKPALLDWAARERYPVHYASLTYRTLPGGPPAGFAICWWGTMAFGSHLMGLLRLPRFDAVVDFAAEPVTASSRRALAAELGQAIASRFVAVHA